MRPSLPARARARLSLSAGGLRGQALVELLASLPFDERDGFVDDAFGFPAELPADMLGLPRGAVPYLPCGVDELLAFVRDAPVTADDSVVDVGAGLGRAAILLHLMTGARVHGVELQPHLVQAAQERAASLGVARDVTFTHGDAAEADFRGSAFFLYAPCNGDMLANVVSRLRLAAQRRPIVVGCVGLELDHVPWLWRRPSSCVALASYASRPGVGA